MNIRRTILLLLLIILGIILAYNYLFMGYVMQRGMGMGMGMHGRMWFYGRSGNIIDLKYVWILLISIVGLLAFDFAQPSGKTDRCGKCGKYIEDQKWRICPVCGTRLKRNGGD